MISKGSRNRQNISFAEKKQRRKKTLFSFLLLNAVLFTFLSLHKIHFFRKGKEIYAKIHSQAAKEFLIRDIFFEEDEKTNLSPWVTHAQLKQWVDIGPNQNLLSLSLEKIERQILTHPLMNSVEIQKRFPNALRIRYRLHEAAALGIRKNKVWVISRSGKWLQQVELGMLNKFDFPLLREQQDFHATNMQLHWIEQFEESSLKSLIRLHEIEIHPSHIETLVSLKPPLGGAKLNLLFLEDANENDFYRLKRVITYLIDHGIEVYKIDLRDEKKVVVNIRKRS